MYNKLFTSILDSSIWLEPTATRIVWVTLLAAMDEDGFVRMATVDNLAARARVAIGECAKAVETLQSPDKQCPEQDRQGRRIERVDGGWLVVNAKKYRDIVNREHEKEQNRLRVARHRERKRGNGPVMPANAESQKVTPSEAEAEAEAEACTESEGVAVGDLHARGASGPAATAATPAPLSEAFGGDSQQESAVPVVKPERDRQTAVLDLPNKPRLQEYKSTAQPPKLNGIAGTNKPTVESALAWFAWQSQTTDERWLTEEVREAYRQFDASQDAGGNWKWGKRDVGDWRAAMAQRMSDNREKRGGRKAPTTAADALVRAINGVKVKWNEVEKD